MQACHIFSGLAATILAYSVGFGSGARYPPIFGFDVGELLTGMLNLGRSYLHRSQACLA